MRPTRATATTSLWASSPTAKAGTITITPIPGRARLCRLGQSGRLDGGAGPDRLDPPGFEPAVNGAGRIGPVGDHPRDQPEIVHAMHDDAAEIGLAEIALHVVVVEMQRVVVERGVAEQTDRFATDGKFRALDGVSGIQALKHRRHDRVPLR